MKKARLRALIVFWSLFFGLLLIMGRAFQFQIVPDERLQSFSENKSRWNERKSKEGFLKSRGVIYDRNDKQLALSLISKSFFANPKLINQPRSVAFKLAKYLDAKPDKIENLLEQDRFFVWLQREVDERTARKIQGLEIQGIHYSKESKRIYPHGSVAKSVLGIAGRDGLGLEGVEKSYDAWLQVSDRAKEPGIRDALGRRLMFRDFDQQWFEAYDVHLTLDLRLQRILEQELRATLHQTDSITAQGVMMNPKTGEILAMASMDGKRAESPGFRNRVVSDLYEPGSTFKVMVAMAALEKLHLNANSQIFAENGTLRIGPNSVKEYNHKKFSWLTLEEMLNKSSNVAAAKLGIRLGAQNLYESISRFGFGEQTKIDLPGEARGILRPYKDWKPIDLANISFGQGIAATPLQVVRAFSAIANGGFLVQPHVVSRISSTDSEVWRFPYEKREVIRPHVARQLTEMLATVTEDGGTGGKAAIAGYRVAGKTGTSQKLVERETKDGRKYKTYSINESIVSFAGYVPAGDPAFVLLVIYDDPQGVASGGFTAAPSFQRIASRSLAILGVKPQVASKSGQLVPESVDSLFVGREFRDVLREVKQWEEKKREKVKLIGYGRAVREEVSEGEILVYFEPRQSD